MNTLTLVRTPWKQRFTFLRHEFEEERRPPETWSLVSRDCPHFKPSRPAAAAGRGTLAGAGCPHACARASQPKARRKVTAASRCSLLAKRRKPAELCCEPPCRTEASSKPNKEGNWESKALLGSVGARLPSHNTRAGSQAMAAMPRGTALASLSRRQGTERKATGCKNEGSKTAAAGKQMTTVFLQALPVAQSLCNYHPSRWHLLQAWLM